MRVDRDAPFVHKLAERKADRGFQPDNAERAALEFLHLLAARVRRVIRGDGIHRAR